MAESPPLPGPSGPSETQRCEVLYRISMVTSDRLRTRPEKREGNSDRNIVRSHPPTSAQLPQTPKKLDGRSRAENRSQIL